METPRMHEVVKVAGGTPIPIPWTEIYTSIQQGVIDGLECPTKVQNKLSAVVHKYGKNA